MALSKRTYAAGIKITAENLNAIQDEVIRIAGQLGKDISSATIDSSGHLILTLTDGSTIDAGTAKGSKGDTGGTGPAYTLTDNDKASIVSAVLAAIDDGTEVSY